MAQQITAEQKTKLLELTRAKYSDQAKWYLNGFWKKGAEQESENIWKFAQKFIELDPKKKKEMNWMNSGPTNSWNHWVKHSP